MDLDELTSMLTELGMQLPESASKEAQLEELVQSVNPLRLKNNPVALNSDVLRQMYRRIVR